MHLINQIMMIADYTLSDMNNWIARAVSMLNYDPVPHFGFIVQTTAKCAWSSPVVALNLSQDSI